MKQKVVSRLTALLLMLALVVTNIPMTTFATGVEDQSENAVEEQITTFSTKESTLAPGITQTINSGYAADGKLINYYVAIADISRDDVGVHTTYKDAQCTTTGMAKMTEQAASMEKLHLNPDDADNYIPYYAIVAGVNGDGYNTGSGAPSGAHVMNGVSGFGIQKAANSSWFAIFEDGTALCGANNTDWDEAVATHGPAQEAIGGFQLVRKNGVDCSYTNDSYLNDGRYPRSFVGVTADNKVVFMEADGNGSGGSVGTNWKESVEIMDEAGCTYILCLDGGGSATYISRPAGSNGIQVTSKPSDGSERAVSNGLVMYTTTPPSDTFEKAEITAENYYVTPGSEVKVSAVGISPAGTSAEIPENAVWTATNGSIKDNMFVSDGTIGAAKIALTVDGVEVGTTTINVVMPDKISFTRDKITVPFGSSTELEVVAKYGLYDVVMNDDDVTFTMTDSTAGTLVGNKFTAAGTGAGTTITVTVNNTDPVVSDSIQVNFGKGSDVLFDFEKGNIGADLTNWRTSHHGGYDVSDLSIVTEETGKVHSGEQALAFHYPMDEALHGTEFWSGNSLVWTGDAVEILNATSVGMWVYIPEDATQFSYYMSVSLHDEKGEFAGRTGSSMEIYNDDIVNNREHSGWTYIKIPISKDAVYLEDNADKIGNYYNGAQFKLKANCFIEFYAVNIDAWKENETNFAGDFTFYIDDVTVDYSNAVDDRELPIFSGITYAVEGMSDAAVLEGQTVNDKIVDFAALVTEDTTNPDNASGLDASSAIAYVDGVEVDCEYSDGKITVTDAKLTNGVHTIRMGICDKAGNYAETKRQITVKSNDNDPSVRVKPKDSSLENILNGAVYWIDVEVDDIEKVKTVEAKLDLDSMNDWELEHIDVLHGFDCEYSYASAAEKAENILTIKFTRNNDYLSATGTTVLASIPVRVWEYVCSDDHKHGNAVEAWYCNYVCAPALSIDVDTEMGVVTYYDGANHTFSSKDIHTSGVSYTYGVRMKNHDSNHYNSNSYHLHNIVEIEDKKATCTTDGYTGRTMCSGADGTRVFYCTKAEHTHSLEAKCYSLNCTNTEESHEHSIEKCYKTICKKTVHTHSAASGSCYYTHKSCNSIVDWGTTIPATGHSFKLTEGVLKCNCGQTFTGTWEDGKEYTDGVATADGWVGDSYYKDGKKLTGIQLADGYYYDFGENGVCEGKVKYTGLFYDDTVSAWRYSKLGALYGGWAQIDNNWHFFRGDVKIAAVGRGVYKGVTYVFNEQGMTKGAWYNDGVGIRYSYGPADYEARDANYMTFQEIDGKIYNFDVDGYLTTGIHALMDGAFVLKKYVYDFGEDGALVKQITEEGPVKAADGALYYINEDGYVPMNAGVVKCGNTFYYVVYSGKIAVNSRRYINETNSNGLLPNGWYNFGADGSLFTGVKENTDGELCYYVNDKLATGNPGLVKVGDAIYDVKWSGKVAVNEWRYITPELAHDLMDVGDNYKKCYFGADGKFVPEFSGVKAGADGVLYYYNDGKIVTGKPGLVEVEGALYDVKWSGKVAVNEWRYITPELAHDLMDVGDNYKKCYFGADGKLVPPYTGVKKDVDGYWYYYDNGKIVTGKPGLVEVEGALYDVKWSGKVAINEWRYITPELAHDLMDVGKYYRKCYFGADGKLVND